MATSTLSYSQFLGQVTSSRKNALLLDYDGTLAPFTEDRDHAEPYPGVRDLLRRILASGRTRLVLVSGRMAHEVKRLLGLDPAPEIWGVHGLERLLPSGEYFLREVSSHEQAGLGEAMAWLKEERLENLAEVKPGGIAVHWRGLNSGTVEAVRSSVQRAWQPIAAESDLYLAGFDGGIELRVRSATKADAVRTLLSEIDETMPVAYLGDDLTDEDAFRAIQGRGLPLLVRPEYRPTAAAAWLKPPKELVGFLAAWLPVEGGTHE